MASYQMGVNTLKVPMTLFKENRAKLIGELKKVQRLDAKAVVLLQGGDNISLYDTDVDYVFRQVSKCFAIFSISTPNLINEKSSHIEKCVCGISKVMCFKCHLMEMTNKINVLLSFALKRELKQEWEISSILTVHCPVICFDDTMTDVIYFHSTFKYKTVLCFAFVSTRIRGVLFWITC